MADYDQNNPGTNESDDLTRFLDEDFGTDEVDLFEFTSGEEESPLKQLKAIILGLDWEITDEALQDLADEIEHLRYLEQFEHDKVTQVYLQALDKIGNYLLIEGAYAHPNAIKLLLSLYYDFEKITSSDIITGAEITALLKADVRKFKILQYQIAQKHGAEVSEATEAAAALPLTDHKTLLDIHAAILELDWEVSDESLETLKEHLTVLKDQFVDNRYIQIVIKGLITLNTYIDEERARAHPEAFSMLHHFFEALETLVDDKELDDERSQKILISCVNRLNHLKTLITQTPQELAEEAITPIAEEEAVPEPVAEEETEPVAVTTAAEEDEYEDELDVELPVDETGEVAPALLDSGEEGGFAGTAEAPSDELSDKLESFFGEEEAAPSPPAEAETETVAEEEAPKAEIEGVAGEREAEDVLDVELPVDESGEVAPALFDEGEEGGFAGTAEAEEAPPEELADRLDSFFGGEEVAPPPSEEEIVEAPIEEEAPAAEAGAEIPTTAIEGVAGEKEAEDELDVELPVDETGEVAPALFDEGEEGGFSEEAEGEAPPEELEDKLNFFFGESEEESFEPEAVEEKVAQEKAAEKERLAEEQRRKEEEEEVLSVTPALSGEPEDSGFTVEEETKTAPEELSTKLDSFFGEETGEEAAEVTEEEEPSLTADEGPEALFEEEEEEEEVLLTTPAPPVEEEVTGITTQADFDTQLAKMRAEFQDREQSLLNEIASLKEEIESLKTQLE